MPPRYKLTHLYRHMNIPIKIIVVDDHAAFARLFCQSLERLLPGACVHYAPSREEALLDIISQEFDLAFIDMQLGTAEGGELRQTIEQLYYAGSIKRAPVMIAISGITEFEDAAGFFDFWPKAGLAEDLPVRLIETIALLGTGDEVHA